MEVDFEIKLDCNCLLNITGTSKYPETESYLNFLYKDSVTINIVTLEETNNLLLVAITYDTHNGYLDETNLQVNKDGTYNITLLIVPSLEWYNKLKKLEQNNFYRYDSIYISDGKNLYKVTDSGYTEIDPVKFITNVSLNRTTIVKKLKIAFLTCFLWKCYISLAKEVLLDLLNNNLGLGKISRCGNENEETKDKIYRRDFIWATINVINYLIDDCKFEKAQLILEEIQGCNGFCNSSNTLETISLTGNNYLLGCGCNKD